MIRRGGVVVAICPAFAARYLRLRRVVGCLRAAARVADIEKSGWSFDE
jgi:hypothetical protein